jgi:hypothetical protein
VSAPPALEAPQREQLERLVGTARRLLEADLADQAEGRFGLHASGRIEDPEALRLDPTSGHHRAVLVEVVQHLQTLGESRAGAVARLIREAAFTHFNRLVAIRIAEATGLVPESLAQGDQSDGFRQLVEITPLLADDYWAYLQLVGDELAADAPNLFDPRNPLLELAPTPRCVEKLVELFADPAASGLWEAADTLGWSYQFFNTGEERRAMREASAAPRDSRELAVRNQFFTPRYVVDFLVQNTLGRRLIESDPTSPLLDELPLLVDPPTAPGPDLDLDAVKALDPACGSGHFLLGCYDLLERAWALRGVGASDAAPKIVASLWGVEIDPRCTQIASAAIMLRARRHCRESSLPKPNIICARPLPASDGAPAGLDTDLQRLVGAVSETLEQAPVLGVLLKAEEHLDAELRGMVFGNTPGALTIADDVYDATEGRLLGSLEQIADRTTASVGDRLFAAEAGDALRFIDVCRTRFDVVLMNPPFGDPVVNTEPYLRAKYPCLPTDANLLTAFVERGLQLCTPNGYLGAVTSRVGMFLTTYNAWRTQVLLGNRLTTLADLGIGVMEQALVEAAAYVIGPGMPPADHAATFVRLLKDTDRPAALTASTAASRAGANDARIFRVLLRDFDEMPSAAVAYWMSPSLRRLFTDLPQLEDSAADVRRGLETGDDSRFVRAFWEVDPRRIARSREETKQGNHWCPFAKGGEYSPYWDDIHLVVEYEEDGTRLRRAGTPDYYFRPGLTWPRRTASGFGPRMLPAGCVFGEKGPSVFPSGAELGLIAAWLTSRIAQALLSGMLAAADETTSGAASKSYEMSLVQRLPWPGGELDGEASNVMSTRARMVATALADLDRLDETARRFVRPAAAEAGSVLAGAEMYQRRSEDDGLRAIAASAEIDALLSSALALDEAAVAYLDEEAGEHVDRYPRDREIDDSLLEKYFAADIDSLVDTLIDTVGAERIVATKSYIADRRLELIAHGLQTHPATVVEARRRCELLPPDEPRATAEELVSYLFGCAIGRWDVRIGQDPSLAPPAPDLFDPVPLCPPGMLVGPDGFPATEGPADYPLQLPSGRILVDEPGHAWDVEARILDAAEALFANPDAVVAEALNVLGRRSLRDYMRRDFFKAHLRRYSKSRRKAPIYWYLTPKRAPWGVWLYAPALSREMIYAVAHEAQRRERLAEEALIRLEEEKQRGGHGRPVRRVIEELDTETRLAEQVRTFRLEAQRVADLGWDPELDDGIALCAAPLAELMPTWPEAATQRANIKKGTYPWAVVSRWKDML